MVTPSDLAAHQPHLRLGPVQLATLFVKGLVSDWRERRGSVRPQDDRPWWRALDPRVHDPIFVVGAPRSGTSFLGDCLGAVPGVSYHFEPRLTKAAIRDVYTGAWSRTRAQWTFRTFYGALLIFALDGGRRFVDKTPENSFIVPILAQTFPTARFVHIVRDGRDVAVSHSERPWLSARSAGSAQRGRGGAAWGPYPRFWVEPERRERFPTVTDIERSAWCWRRFTGAACAHLAGLAPDRAYQLRYEDLVEDPGRVSARLAEFLGLDGRGSDALRAATARARASSVGRWRELAERDRRLVEAECGPLLTELGYR